MNTSTPLSIVVSLSMLLIAVSIRCTPDNESKDESKPTHWPYQPPKRFRVRSIDNGNSHELSIGQSSRGTSVRLAGDQQGDSDRVVSTTAFDAEVVDSTFLVVTYYIRGTTSSRLTKVIATDGMRLYEVAAFSSGSEFYTRYLPAEFHDLEHEDSISAHLELSDSMFHDVHSIPGADAREWHLAERFYSYSDDGSAPVEYSDTLDLQFSATDNVFYSDTLRVAGVTFLDRDTECEQTVTALLPIIRLRRSMYAFWRDTWYVLHGDGTFATFDR